MAASSTLTQQNISRKSPVSKSGVLTIHGFGVRLRMQSGHLEIDFGVGPERLNFRLPRVGHGLKRLVCISEDGVITLAALRWLSDIGVPFVMLDRLGKVRFVTGPTSPSDARLRRAQAIAVYTGVHVTIARELISQKLAGQERVARDIIRNKTAADEIADYRLSLAETESLDAIRLCESRGAAAYWAAWQELAVLFPTKDLPRIPAHWCNFNTRKSPLTGSQRMAVNPPNAILNYLYALLEAEARGALAALGLDPGLGFIHVDTPARDSLACDLMEVGRPAVDAYVLRLMQQPFRRDWFFETKEGNCRLMASFTAQLSSTAPMWARAVAPSAEWIARQLWSANRKVARDTAPPTRLTQRQKREAKGSPLLPLLERAPRAETFCYGCGKSIRDGRRHCAECAIPDAKKRLAIAAQSGRVVAHSPAARAKEGQKQRQYANARSLWKRTGQASMTPEQYREIIQPLLTSISTSMIAKAIGVSRWYAGRIRKGYRPHPRHWLAIAQMVGFPHEHWPKQNQI
jgi:CRISPR-associated endonuclease Cas1